VSLIVVSAGPCARNGLDIANAASNPSAAETITSVAIR
jgi:hypothetical protein